MTSIIADFQASSSFLAPLASASLRAIALAGVAGVGLAAFRVKATSMRLFTWTAVLYASLALPLLQWMLPSLPVPAPEFLKSKIAQPAAHLVTVSQLRSAVWADPNTTSTPAASILTSDSSFDSSGVQWMLVASGIYCVVSFALLTRLLVGLIVSGRIRRSSQTISDAVLTASLATHAQADELSFIPEAAESAFVSVPVTVGVLHPIILLPTTWPEWDQMKLDAVVAHEVSHVARRDTLTQHLAFLHCAIFWFSPLGWWLKRHLADLMEQASDEAALAIGVDRKVYAKTLLGFFEAVHAARGRVWWQGVAMAASGHAERRAEDRVEKILVWKGSVAMHVKKSLAIVVVALAVPVVYLTASAQPADRSAGSVNSQVLEIAQNQTPPSAAPAKAPRASRKSSSHSSYSYGYDDAESFIMVSGGDASVTMSGGDDRGARIDELKKRFSGDFIWFRRDGKAYVIRDQATIDRAKAFWAPQEELGKKQEELGKQQEALGTQQEALSEKMEQVRVKVPDMTKEIEKLQATLKKLNSDATMEQIGQIQSDIGDLQSKIGDLQSSAGDQQSKLGEEMGALGEKQGKLGEQQGELGRQQDELAQQATRQMKQLLDESITKGTAQLDSTIAPL